MRLKYYVDKVTFAFVVGFDITFVTCAGTFPDVFCIPACVGISFDPFWLAVVGFTVLLGGDVAKSVVGATTATGHFTKLGRVVV